MIPGSEETVTANDTSLQPSNPTGPAAAAPFVLDDTASASDALARGDATDEPDAEPDRGAIIGRFVVLYKLGAGGMGLVLAAYDPELDRKVALKLLRPRARANADRTQAALRLHREALALARLSHANIVSVHDVGVHRDRVFVAMEYVEGQTLSAWLHAQPRTWREVVHVFDQAGRGLEHAHQKGLVHRDFKPDNVMIGDDARVRLMDFGLVRTELSDETTPPATQPDETGSSSDALATPLTRAGAILGTPAYMSPEQLRGDPVTALSDQFSFCVALYEALYGERPYAGGSLAELILAFDGQQLRTPPGPANVPAFVHRALVRGLAVDRERRWPSVQALLAALADDPAPRRRRRTLAAVAAVVLGLGVYGGLAARAADARVCTGMAEKLTGLWDADRRAAAGQAILGTGLGYAPAVWERAAPLLDDYADRWVTARTDACEATRRGEQSGELLDLRMACLDQRLLHLRTTVDQLVQADDTVVRTAVQAALELPRIERCADVDALRAEVAPPEDPAVAARVAALDEQLIEAEARERAGKYAVGLAAVEPILAEAATLGYAPLQARALLLKGSLIGRAGDYEPAAAQLEVALHATLGQRMLPQAALAATKLVDVVGVRLSRLEDGRRWGKYADSLTRAAASDELRALYLNNIGNVYYLDSKYPEARAYFDEALALRERVLGPDHPETSTTLGNLGNLAFREGHMDDARALHERSLAIKMRALGPEHPDTARNLVSLGIVGSSLATSRQFYERALAISETALGPDHPDVGNVLHHLGVVESSDSNYAAARTYYERALAAQEKSLGRDHPRNALTIRNLGEIEAHLGRYEAARDHHEQALALFLAAMGPDHLEVSAALTSLGHTLTLMGEYAEARRHLERAVVIQEQRKGPDRVALPLIALADVDIAEGRLPQARAHLDRAARFWEQSQGPDSRWVALIRYRLGDVAAAEGKHDEARVEYERALANYEGSYGADHPDMADPLRGLAELALAQDRPADALPLLERALTILDAKPGDPAELAALRFVLARALWTAPPERGGDRERARELARLARGSLAAAGKGKASRLAALDAWLREHDRDAPAHSSRSPASSP